MLPRFVMAAKKSRSRESSIPLARRWLSQLASTVAGYSRNEPPSRAVKAIRQCGVTFDKHPQPWHSQEVQRLCRSPFGGRRGVSLLFISNSQDTAIWEVERPSHCSGRITSADPEAIRLPSIATPGKVPRHPLSACIFAPLNEWGMVSGVIVDHSKARLSDR